MNLRIADGNEVKKGWLPNIKEERGERPDGI